MTAAPAIATLATHGRAVEVEAPPRAGLTHADLAELISSFSEAAKGLEATHDALRAEVARLQRELSGANEQLRRSQSLAALGEMAAGIAHEVRNPLAAVALHARLLETDLEPWPALRASATKIAGAVRTADAVVADVLAFAREATLRPTETTAQEALTDAAEACEHLLASRAGVRLTRADRAPGRPDVPLLCDTGLLRQALVNLIRNALDAIDDSPVPPGGHALTLDAQPRVVLTPRGERRPMVALVVRDTGPGLPEGVVERMFNPFFTTRATGTGLGLAIVHRIVDAHGGRVAVRNAEAPPSGAIVEILLPDPSHTPQESAA